MVWCARALVFHRDPPVPMAEALDKRTDILRKTSHYDGRHPDGFYEHLDFRPFKGYRKSYF